MTKEAAGNYECTGINEVGTARGKITVNMHTTPKLTKQGRPSEQILTEGETAIFMCQTTEDTNPQATVEWMINGELIQEHLSHSRLEVTTIERGAELTIYNLTQYNTAVIQCKASNQYKTIYTNAPLIVLRKTELIDKAINQSFDSNTTKIGLQCRATSDPRTPSSVEWQRDGKALCDYDDYRMMENKITGNLTLNLTGLDDDKKAAYSGEYMCTATNGYTTDSHTAVLEYRNVWKIGLPGWAIAIIILTIIVVIVLIIILVYWICTRRNSLSYTVN